MKVKLMSPATTGEGCPVYLTQPPYNDPRVLVTPHAAFYSSESVESLRRRAAHQVGQRLQGREPEDVVNPGVLA